MGTKVAKFGGSSLADAPDFHAVRDIVRADPDRRYVVPSAPGKRFPKDRKITDLLYLCHEHARQGLAFQEVFHIVCERFRSIAADLGLGMDLGPHFDRIARDITAGAEAGAPADYAASRGEYLNGLILAEVLGYEFLDAAELIPFDPHGRFDSERAEEVLRQRLPHHGPAVIPGFYGAMPDGRVRTFARGGSDVSGAVVARGAHADVYENWTDVSGLLMADPAVVDNPLPIDRLTYQELRELSYMGASALHDEAIFPVREVGIPVHIRNSRDPEHPGTMIVRQAPEITSAGYITGIAGRKDFTVVHVEKTLMNQEVGFGRRLLSVLEANRISFEHLPSSIDTMSVVVDDAEVGDNLEGVLEQIRWECGADAVETSSNMALIATVGRGMAYSPGVAGKLFSALGDAGINIRMIDQGSSELNIIVGVEVEDFERAVQAIYHAFVS